MFMFPTRRDKEMGGQSLVVEEADEEEMMKHGRINCAFFFFDSLIFTWF